MVGIKDFDIPSCCSECQMASCKGLSGQFYCDITTYDVDMDDTERDADCPLIEAIPKDQYEARLKADIVDILDKIRANLHYNAEMHEDGDWYLRLEWVDEILDKYKSESEKNEK